MKNILKNCEIIQNSYREHEIMKNICIEYKQRIADIGFSQKVKCEI